MRSSPPVTQSWGACHGRSLPLLLPGPELPRLRQAGPRQSDGLRPLRQDPAPSGCSTAAPARPGSPSGREPPCSARRLPEDKALDVIGHLADRNGVRATARLVGVHRDTVVRYGRRPGRARPATPRRARGFFPLGPKRSSSTRSGPTSSRSRSTATRTTRPMPSAAIGGITRPMTPSTGWSSASSPGPRTAENVEAVVADVHQRTEGRPLRLMTSDDYPAYKEAILHVYGRRSRRRRRAATASGWCPRRCRHRS